MGTQVNSKKSLKPLVLDLDQIIDRGHRTSGRHPVPRATGGSDRIAIFLRHDLAVKDAYVSVRVNANGSWNGHAQTPLHVSRRSTPNQFVCARRKPLRSQFQPLRATGSPIA